MIEPQDLRTAVQRGLITEMQAAGLTSIADDRRHARSSVVAGEEPFVLFKGFNEIFIVIGLSILFGGWIGTLTLLSGDVFADSSPSLFLICGLTFVGLAFVQRYFTLQRRMIAPSIALAVMFTMTLSTLAGLLVDLVPMPMALASSVLWTLVAAGMVVHYHYFKVPITAAIIATCLFSAVWTYFARVGMVPDTTLAMLHFSGQGLPGLLSILFGLVSFAAAMRFDMSDPHRVSTRSATGFWLHVLAAPAIINPVAMQLLDQGAGGNVILLIVLCLLAVVAIVIDRRSFLVSGAGYAVWLLFTLFDGSLLVILLLGFGLVFLGAQWESLRRALLLALPEFPGKDRLPPYGSPKLND